jgi:hypothetical protein
MKTDAEIREHLGHNGHECRVRIKRDGTVERHGSPISDTDRSRDWWCYVGTRESISDQMEMDEQDAAYRARLADLS